MSNTGHSPPGRLTAIVRAASQPYMVQDHGDGQQTWEQPGAEEVASAVVGFIRGLVNAEADAAHERSRALDPPRILSGFDWFEWGLRRAVAVIEGTDRFDLTSLPMDPAEPVENA